MTRSVLEVILSVHMTNALMRRAVETLNDKRHKHSTEKRCRYSAVKLLRIISLRCNVRVMKGLDQCVAARAV